jgi:hypothetical protein
MAYCELLLADDGMYIKPEFGLKDIGAQLCPPPGPGMIMVVWSFRKGFGSNRVFRS